jgi:hypothetical protein
VCIKDCVCVPQNKSDRDQGDLSALNLRGKYWFVPEERDVHLGNGTLVDRIAISACSREDCQERRARGERLKL